MTAPVVACTRCRALLGAAETVLGVHWGSLACTREVHRRLLRDAGFVLAVLPDKEETGAALRAFYRFVAPLYPGVPVLPGLVLGDDYAPSPALADPRTPALRGPNQSLYGDGLAPWFRFGWDRVWAILVFAVDLNALHGNPADWSPAHADLREAPFRSVLNHARHVLADPVFRDRLVTVSRYDLAAAAVYLRESLPVMP